MDIKRGFGCHYVPSSRARLLGVVLASGLAVVGAAATASAQCSNFTVTQISDTLVPGDTDIGNHGDDVTTTISLPFTWSMYGVPYSSAVISSNGTVQFATNSTAYTNGCLPTTTFAGPVIFPHWDDQRTDAADKGIFTSVSGTSPNQIFNIEWRTTYYGDGQPLNYALRLYEGQGRFDVVYASIPNVGVSATVGVQASASGPMNQFSCNTSSLGGVQGLSFDCPTTAGPSCTLAVSPSSGASGNTFLATATVIPGFNPASTGITARIDASAINGGTVSLYDDGLNGDAAAGDNIYSGLVVVGAGAPLGPQTLISTVGDLEARTSTCSSSYFVDDAGDTIANAAHPSVSDGFISGTLHTGDADMFLLHICDPATFSASTVGGSTVDTQLFLFKPNGTGVVTNDDDATAGTTHLQSLITNALTTGIPAGEYYLAISQYDKDPLDSSNAQLWLDTVGGTFRVEHAPDGPGAVSPIDHWDATAGAGGSYTITLTGVSSTPCGPTCDTADYNGDGDTGTDLDIEAFFACLAGDCCATCPINADFNRDGDVGTDLDIEAFFRVLGGQPC